MDKFFKKLVGPAKWILIIGGFVFAALWSLSNVSFNGDFLPVLSSSIIALVGLFVLCVVPFMLIVKKDEIAKMVFLVLVGYWLISGILANFGHAGFASEGSPWYAVVYGVLGFIYGSLMLAILVFIVLSLITKKPLFRQLVGLGLLALIATGILVYIFGVITAAKADWGWDVHLYLIADYIVSPILVLCGSLVFLFKSKAE